MTANKGPLSADVSAIIAKLTPKIKSNIAVRKVKKIDIKNSDICFTTQNFISIINLLKK